MRKGWVETKLIDAVEILDRFRKPVNASDRQVRQGSVPYYGANGQAGWIDDSIFNEELVLLGEDAIDFADPQARKAYLISGPSWVNNHAHVLRAIPKVVYSYFLTEALNRVDYSRYVSFGTRSKLTQGSMKEIKVLLPPLLEQKRIVDLISSVDSYIEALQQQLQSAQNSRNAVLHEMLSVGGEGWIETVLGEIVSIINGGAPSTKKPEYWDGGIPWITTTELTHFDGKVIGDSQRTLTQLGLKEGPSKLVEKGTILLGTTATIGTIGFVQEPVAFNQQISGLKIKSNHNDPWFVFYYLQSIKYKLENLSAGTSFKRIATSILKTVPMVIPPSTEQKRIVDLISTMDDGISAIEKLIIETMQLRSGLLSVLLSGEHEIPASYDKFMGVA